MMGLHVLEVSRRYYNFGDQEIIIFAFISLSLAHAHTHTTLFMFVMQDSSLHIPRERNRVWVQCKKEDILAAESSAGDYNQLANALLDIVFEEELQTPDRYCCTTSKGKELLNEERMKGIRS